MERHEAAVDALGHLLAAHQSPDRAAGVATGEDLGGAIATARRSVPRAAIERGTAGTVSGSAAFRGAGSEVVGVVVGTRGLRGIAPPRPAHSAFGRDVAYDREHAVVRAVVRGEVHRRSAASMSAMEPIGIQE